MQLAETGRAESFRFRYQSIGGSNQTCLPAKWKVEAGMEMSECLFF
jgi:hypothetical protein